MYFDSHCHIQLSDTSRQYRKSPLIANSCGYDSAARIRISQLHENYILSAVQVGVVGISVCAVCPSEDFDAVLSLARSSALRVVISVGLHPWWIPLYLQRLRTRKNIAELSQSDFEALIWNDLTEELTRVVASPMPILVGIGECGLDRPLSKRRADSQRNDPPVSMELQELILRAQIVVAVKYHRPLTLHCVGCWERLFFICRQSLLFEQTSSALTESTPIPMPMPIDTTGESGLLTIILHSCNRLPPSLVNAFMTQLPKGTKTFFSFSALSADAKHERDLLPLIPLNRLLIETDAPDQCPLKTSTTSDDVNQPANVVMVCSQVADVLGLTVSEIATQTTSNAFNAFGIT